MDFRDSSRKEIGNFGELAVAEYLRRKGAFIIGRNIAWKTGELDVIAKRGNVLHFVEVKSMLCEEFPKGDEHDIYDPASNLHAYKINKVVRTAEWFVMRNDWAGEWQVDGALVWIRARDGMARIRYYPQIL